MTFIEYDYEIAKANLKTLMKSPSLDRRFK